MFEPAARAVTRKCRGWRRMTSSVFRPIVPVEPRMATFFIRSSLPEIANEIIKERSGEDQAVDPVQEPAVPGKDVGRILDPDRPFEQRFQRVADLGGGAGPKTR